MSVSRMRAIKKLPGRQWRRLIMYALVLVVIAAALVLHLGALTHGLSSGERAVQLTDISAGSLARDPLYLPLELLRYGLFAIISPEHAFVLRLPNVVLGFLTLLLFAGIVRRWYGFRIAVLSCLLFGLSSWFLHVSRLATPDVVYLFGVVALMYLCAIAAKQNTKRWFLIGGSLLLWLLAFTPGMIWLIAASLYVLAPHLRTGWRQLGGRWGRVALLVWWIVLLALVVAPLVHSPDILRQWAGLPPQLSTPVDILQRFGMLWVHLFIKGGSDPLLWVGPVAAFSFFATVMIAIGAWFYGQHFTAPRTLLLTGFILLSAVLAALGGPVPISTLVPVFFIVAGGGMAYLLHQWLQVFPFNPIARGVGIALVTLAVAVTAIFNLRAYFVAWPHIGSTQAAFREYPPKNRP